MRAKAASIDPDREGIAIDPEPLRARRYLRYDAFPVEGLS
jgi:hypothetical protein